MRQTCVMSAVLGPIRPESQEVIYTCTLRFADGAVVTAQIRPRCRYEDCIVTYQGPIERLPFAFERADAINLPAYFMSFARELHARFQEVKTGEWPSEEG